MSFELFPKMANFSGSHYSNEALLFPHNKNFLIVSHKYTKFGTVMMKSLTTGVLPFKITASSPSKRLAGGGKNITIKDVIQCQASKFS